mmetsp:Transcript_21319/g.41360  ORF Transcript_21319/g.41360 Transcript_21319/m.41360 type:complete len:423 (-) Transcript_21319:68-1336(-)
MNKASKSSLSSKTASPPRSIYFTDENMDSVSPLSRSPMRTASKVLQSAQHNTDTKQRKLHRSMYCNNSSLPGQKSVEKTSRFLVDHTSAGMKLEREAKVAYAFLQESDIKKVLGHKAPTINRENDRRLPHGLSDASAVAMNILPDTPMAVSAVRGFQHLESLQQWHVVTVVAVRLGNQRPVLRMNNDFEVSKRVHDEVTAAVKAGGEFNSELARSLNAYNNETKNGRPTYCSSDSQTAKDPLRIVSGGASSSAENLGQMLKSAMLQAKHFSTELGRNMQSDFRIRLLSKIEETRAFYPDIDAEEAWELLSACPNSNTYLIRNANKRDMEGLSCEFRYWVISLYRRSFTERTKRDYKSWNVPIAEHRLNHRFYHDFTNGSKARFYDLQSLIHKNVFGGEQCKPKMPIYIGSGGHCYDARLDEE